MASLTRRVIASLAINNYSPEVAIAARNGRSVVAVAAFGAWWRPGRGAVVAVAAWARHGRGMGGGYTRSAGDAT